MIYFQNILMNEGKFIYIASIENNYIGEKSAVQEKKKELSWKL